MKYLLLFISLTTLSLFYTGCTKDKAPNIIFDPTCSDTISFSQDILPMFQSYCVSCHDDGNSTGYTLNNHSNISSNSSQAIGAMRADGYQLMPQGGPAMPDSLIKMYSCWIQNGKKDN